MRMKMNIRIGIEPEIETRKGRDEDWYGDSWRLRTRIERDGRRTGTETEIRHLISPG